MRQIYIHSWNSQKVLADVGYKGQFTALLRMQDTKLKYQISSRPPTERGFVPVKKRWVIERTFSWLNFFRRFNKDYEKSVQSTESMIYIAQVQTLLNRNIKSTI